MEELLTRVAELSHRAEARNVLTHTGFLTPSECAAAQKPGFPNSYAFGGYPDAERKMLFFLPDYCTPEDAHEAIAALAVNAPFSSLTHRDYLGSLLALGIKRDCVGDILVDETRATLLLDAKIAPFVRENLTRAGRSGLSVSELPCTAITPPVQTFSVRECTVASPRADALFAAAFGLSRERAADALREGRCEVNWNPVTSPAAPLSEGDVLSLRGTGRAKLSAFGGTSKKGRTFITIHVYE